MPRLYISEMFLILRKNRQLFSNFFMESQAAGYLVKVVDIFHTDTSYFVFLLAFIYFLDILKPFEYIRTASQGKKAHNRS